MSCDFGVFVRGELMFFYSVLSPPLPYGMFYFTFMNSSLTDFLNQCLIPFGCYNRQYCRLGILNKYLCLTVLEAGKSKIKMPADLVSGENSLPVHKIFS